MPIPGNIQPLIHCGVSVSGHCLIYNYIFIITKHKAFGSYEAISNKECYTRKC